MKTLTNRRALWPCALLLLSPTLTGCGGGGSATTPAALVQPAAVTLSGIIQDAGANPLSGYTVTYTPATAAHARQAQATTSDTLTAVTNSQGHYSLSIPTAQITANATLTVFDTTGVQVQTQTLTLDPTKSTQTTVVTVTSPTSTTTSTPVDTPPAPPAPPV